MTRGMILFLVLQALDLASTLAIYYVVGKDPMIESNPVARCVLASGGWLALSAFKGVGVSLFSFVYSHLDESRRCRILDVVNGIMLAVVAGNAFALHQMLQ